MTGLTLYNCVTCIGPDDHRKYRITKFIDGEVSSSYLTTRDTCHCPRGAHHTCRHRQMLVHFLNHSIINQPWFLDWDNTKRVVDFQGNLPPHSVTVRTTDFDSVSEGSTPSAAAIDGEVLGPFDYHVESTFAKPINGEWAEETTPIRTGLPSASWRRL